MENQLLELTKIQIEYVAGFDEKGEAVIKKRTLSNINNGADGATLKNCAAAIMSLQNYEVVGVKRLDTWQI